jgi:ketosteroid isomerase-like protein
MSTQRADEAEVIEVLDRFCSGFASRDSDAVLSVCALEPDLIVVTSEEPLLRGPDELRAFLDRYLEGDTTYSWEWHGHDVSIAGSLAWLLAEGTETAASEEGVARHPYRMTMVLERGDDCWQARQVHGSSPH